MAIISAWNHLSVVHKNRKSLKKGDLAKTAISGENVFCMRTIRELVQQWGVVKTAEGVV